MCGDKNYKYCKTITNGSNGPCRYTLTEIKEHRHASDEKWQGAATEGGEMAIEAGKVATICGDPV
jgi:hypothetical protein